MCPGSRRWQTGIIDSAFDIKRLVPPAVNGRKAQLIRGKVLAFPRTGELDGGDASGFHGHGEDGYRLAWGFAARNGCETSAIDDFALFIERFE
jgi:hypothetical protein